MSMSGDDLAFPVVDDDTCEDFGLSKKEFFAAMALQGALASGKQPAVAASDAVVAASLLIRELNKDIV